MSGIATIQLPDGSTRRLGNKIPDPGAKLKCTYRTYGDVPQAPMISRDKWSPIDLSRYISAVKDQNGIGACNAFDTCYVAEACRAIQGLPPVTLSPGYLYGKINGGVDEGSTLEDALQEMITNGTCEASIVSPLDWKNRPAAAADNAKRYRILEAFECPTFDHMASAIQSGFIVSAGVMWYSNYQTVDSDGWLPRNGRGRAGGHAICRCSLVNRGGNWGLGGPNSWGVSWGVNGFFVLPEPGFEGNVGGWWAVREVVDEGGMVPPLAA